MCLSGAFLGPIVASMFPLCFRLSYPVLMLKEFIEGNRGQGNQLFLLYDVACTLQRHLKVAEYFV